MGHPPLEVRRARARLCRNYLSRFIAGYFIPGYGGRQAAEFFAGPLEPIERGNFLKLRKRWVIDAVNEIVQVRADAFAAIDRLIDPFDRREREVDHGRADQVRPGR